MLLIWLCHVSIQSIFKQNSFFRLKMLAMPFWKVHWRKKKCPNLERRNRRELRARPLSPLLFFILSYILSALLVISSFDYPVRAQSAVSCDIGLQLPGKFCQILSPLLLFFLFFCQMILITSQVNWGTGQQFVFLKTLGVSLLSEALNIISSWSILTSFRAIISDLPNLCNWGHVTWYGQKTGKSLKCIWREEYFLLIWKDFQNTEELRFSF